MKYLGTTLALLAIVYFSSKDSAHTFSTGAPAANTASPGDGGVTCNNTYCHSGPSAQSGENIAISVLQSLDQGSFRILIEVSNSGGMQYEKVGFQACIEDDFGNKIGEISLVDPTRTKFPNGNSDYITHTFTGTAPSDDFLHLWEFDWTPPVNFEGQVANVYAASILSNNNYQNNGDVHVSNHYAFNVGVFVNELSLFDFSVYPNPAQDEIYITFSQKPQDKVVVLLYDFKGSKTILFNDKWGQNIQSILLPSSIRSGLYTLEVRSIYGRSKEVLVVQ